MDTKTELDNEYDTKLKKLKEMCKHQKVTENHDRCAATGEWIDLYITTCDICGAVLSRKTWCVDCHKEIHDDKLMKFLGFELYPDFFKNKDTFFERLYIIKTLGM